MPEEENLEVDGIKIDETSKVILNNIAKYPQSRESAWMTAQDLLSSSRVSLLDLSHLERSPESWAKYINRIHDNMRRKFEDKLSASGKNIPDVDESKAEHMVASFAIEAADKIRGITLNVARNMNIHPSKYLADNNVYIRDISDPEYLAITGDIDVKAINELSMFLNNNPNIKARVLSVVDWHAGRLSGKTNERQNVAIEEFLLNNDGGYSTLH